MATISTGGGHGGKRALDHEIPLIPFIDLLLCCVMFLLVTAVWNQLASVEASLRQPSTESPILEPPPALASLVLHVGIDRIVVAGSAGDRIEIPNLGGALDLVALTEHLTPRRTDVGDVLVVADDGIHFERVIETMDAAASAGFDRVTIGDRL